MRFSQARIVISRVIQDLVRTKYGVDSDLIPNGSVPGSLQSDTREIERFGLERGRYFLQVSRRMDDRAIRGTRELPEPTGDEGCAQQLLAMEIDYGPFEREITFPVDVEIDEAHAEQRNGLLWISLPVRKES